MDYAKLEQWRLATLELARIKEQEMKLRKELFAEGFPLTDEGANALDLQDGWVLKATVPYTRTLDQTKVAELLKDLKKMKAPPTLIKTKYELSVADYKKSGVALSALLSAVTSSVAL